MGRATIRDVARTAGVSVKTVSRVINAEPYVAEATRKRVSAAVRELSYRPNPAAQGLRRAASGAIAFVCEDITEPFAAQLALSIERAVGDEYVVIVASTLGDPTRERETVESLAAGYADGIILGPTPGSKTYLSRLPRGSAVVCIDRPAPDVQTDVVLSDNVGGMSAAVRHLIEAGHTRIAYIADAAEVFTQQERLAGYRAALTEAGLPYDKELVYQHTPDESRLRQHLSWLTQLREPPTALVSGNSLTTLSLVRAGFDLRSDAFIAFDDFPLADVLHGGLNVVAQDVHALGTEATHTLMRRMQDDSAPVRTIRLGTRLLIRQSGARSRDQSVASGDEPRA
jgi:LacI family transcriptional regulator